MNSFTLALNVVFPLFFMMGLGYILNLLKFFNDDLLNKMNNLVFKVFLPIILFVNIYQSDFSRVFNLKLIIFSILSIIIAFVFLLLLIPNIIKKNENVGVTIQGFFRSNFVLFGLPITASLYGDKSTATTAILIAFAVPIFNILSILVLEIFSNKKINLKKLFLNILTNPLIISTVIAAVLVFTKLSIPNVLLTSLRSVGGIATPLALIVLGASFKFKNIFKYKNPLFISVVGKTIIMPLVFLALAVLIGFRNEELVALMAMFASPTAVSSFTMAKSAKANHELAGQIVVMSSLFSIITIFLIVTILLTYQLI